MENIFGETLRKLRTDQGLFQQQLAKILFVNQSCLAGWETGRRIPDAILISRIAAALGADITSMELKIPFYSSDCSPLPKQPVLSHFLFDFDMISPHPQYTVLSAWQTVQKVCHFHMTVICPVKADGHDVWILFSLLMIPVRLFSFFHCIYLP